MKVLILSCNTGQGHNTAARALEEAFLAHGVECEVRDALAFSSERASRVVSNTYVRMASDAPAVFGQFYRLGEKISNPRLRSPVYLANMSYARSLARYIRENKFNAAVTPHLFPAQALSHLTRHGMIDIVTGYVATDYTCYPFMNETDVDAYFIAHPALTGEYLAQGLPESRIFPTGIPVSARFREHPTRQEARDRLNVETEARMLLIMTGSMGFGNASQVVKPLLRHVGDLGRIYVMTGRSESMQRQIEALAEGDERVKAVPYTTEIPLYMSAADVLLTKPGGLTTTEAAALGIPLVHGAMIPGCETANASFFEEKGMAVLAQDGRSAAYALLWLAADAERREAMVKAQRQEINSRAAEDICAKIMDMVGDRKT